jgi:Methyltransferase domain
MKNLDDSQLVVFDTEYVNNDRWRIVTDCIDQGFPSGDFNFIDVGGGNGNFADRLLDAYPRSTGTVLDNSQLLLGRNSVHLRKTLLCESIENLDSVITKKYDLIFFNWVFHHLVGNSYAESRRNITSSLVLASKFLSDRGRISVLDNMYNGSTVDGLPSRLIYGATSSKLLAKVVKKGGANTAGVGVCFLSQKQWDKTIQQGAGLVIEKYTSDEAWNIPKAWNIFLHIDHICCGHFWIK